MSEEERAIDRLLVQELVQRRDQKTPEKYHFIKTGTIYSAAITYESWLQSVYCYTYVYKVRGRTKNESAAELTNQSAAESTGSACKVCGGLCCQSPQRTLYSTADFHSGGLESTRIGLRKST